MGSLDKAISLAALQFVDKFDKGGQPYILHCLWVMNKMPKDDQELRSAAVMHDLLEDTDITEDDLREMGFSERVISAVKHCTHSNKETYEDYIEKQIATNLDAIEIKLYDLEHNSCITRLKGVDDRDGRRIQKYHKAFLYLKDVRDGIRKR